MTSCRQRRFRGRWFEVGVFSALVVSVSVAQPANTNGASGLASTTGQQVTGIADGAWTLSRAIARAMEANPDVLAAKYDVERQEGARLQLVARLLPSVTASAGVNQREQGLVDTQPIPGSSATRDTAVALFGYDLQIQGSYVVFDGLSAWNQVKRQQLLKKQSFLTLHGVVDRTMGAVRQEFDAVLLKTEAVAAAQQRVGEYVQLVEWTERKRKAGEIPEFELLRAEAESEGVRADLAEAKRALGQVEQSFRRRLQLPQSSGSLNLAGKFEPRPFNLPLEEAVGKARANRPDLQAAAIAVEAAQKSLQADKGSYLPKIDAFASYGSRTSYFTSSIRLNGWTYGLNGQWNLFEGGASRGRQMSLRADRRSAEAKLSQTEQDIISRLHELYQGLQHARVAMEAQQKSVSLADRASHDARRQYELGSASLEQVLQAGMTYRQAETRMNDSIYNLNSIIAEIELSVGGQLSDSLPVPDSWKR